MSAFERLVNPFSGNVVTRTVSIAATSPLVVNGQVPHLTVFPAAGATAEGFVFGNVKVDSYDTTVNLSIVCAADICEVGKLPSAPSADTVKALGNAINFVKAGRKFTG